jgi:hypothetical protein
VDGVDKDVLNEMTFNVDVLCNIKEKDTRQNHSQSLSYQDAQEFVRNKDNVVNTIKVGRKERSTLTNK